MQPLLRVSGLIDRINTFLGQWIGWAILLSIVISAVNAVIRKLFNASSNSWLELQWYLFGAAILIASSYTLMRNEHIRIDIISNILPKQVRNGIELFGHIVVLMPFVTLGIYETAPWLALSYRQGEHSSNFGGLLIWPIKFAIFMGFVLLFFQGISEIIKRIAIMRGLIPDTYGHKGSHDAEGAIV
jgi:TRAP-type mannitol/chloroaromatic compound transport system permease small subunit